MRFQTADVKPRSPAPKLGADSRAVVKSLGLTDAEIDALIEQKILRA